MIIAVDFDGTIVEHEYPRIGAPIPFATDTLLQLQRDGHLLILWTVREGELLQEAVDYCRGFGVDFYAINQSFPGERPEEKPSRKLTADLFIDDRNLGGLPDWGQIYHMIKHDRMFEPFDSSVMLMSRNNNRSKNIFLIIGEAIDRIKNGEAAR